MQQKCKEVAKKYGLGDELNSRYISLVSELGELGKEIVKGNNYGSKEFEVTPDTKVEIGDVLFDLMLLVDAMGLNAEECLEVAFEKYAKRFEEKGNIGSVVKDVE